MVQLDGPLQAHRLGRGGHPPDMGHPGRLGLCPPAGHHLLLLVNRYHLGEAVSQGQGDLAGSTGQIHQPALSRDRHPPDQVLPQRGRIRRAVAVVESGGSPVEVSAKIGPGSVRVYSQ